MLQIKCNVCGKVLKTQDDILIEDAFEATKEWGFFSNKDLEVHHFNICEQCYDKMLEKFVIPVEKNKKKEVL